MPIDRMAYRSGRLHWHKVQAASAQDTAGRTSTPAGLAAELIKAPLRLLNLSRRQVNPLHIPYLQVKECHCGIFRLWGFDRALTCVGRPWGSTHLELVLHETDVCEHRALRVSLLLLPTCGCLHLGHRPDPEACRFAKQTYTISARPEQLNRKRPWKVARQVKGGQ